MLAVCVGELALDLIRVPGSPSTLRRFESHLGGSPANLAAGFQAAGLTAVVCSSVGIDPAGTWLMDELRALGLSTECIMQDRARSTRILFLDHADPVRPVRVQTNDCADLHLSAEQFPDVLFDQCRLLYVSGAALQGAHSADAVLSIVDRVAIRSDALIAFDPNITLGESASAASVRTRIHRLLPHVHVLQVAANRLQQYWPDSDGDQLATLVPLLILTYGPRGVELRTKETRVSIPAPKVEVVDPTGAGDSFYARLLASLVSETEFPKGPSLRSDQLEHWGVNAIQAAARVLSVRGSTTAYHLMDS